MDNVERGDFLIQIANESLWEFIGYDKGHMARKAEATPFIGSPDDHHETRDKEYILVKKVGFNATDIKEEWLAIDEFRQEVEN